VSQLHVHRQWARYVQTLQAQPGIVVTTAAKQRGTYVISGLRDPLAVDPHVVLKAFSINPARVSSHWEPYHALDPAFILARAKQELRPPYTVTLPTVFYCNDQLNNAAEQRFAGLKERIQTTVLHFLSHTVQLVPTQAEKFTQLVVDIQALAEIAQVLDKDWRIMVVGHTDGEGAETSNRCLSQRRAEYMCTLLSDHGVATSSLSAVGVAAKVPLRTGLTTEDRTFNQSVSFWIVVSNELR
jgi:OOP family OmpA-OmpF porin